MILNNRAQQVGEYAILIAIVIAAAIGMKIYVQRFLQSRYHVAVLQVPYTMRNVTGNMDIPTQYEPYYLKSLVNANESVYKQKSFLKRIIGGPRPRTATMETTINQQATTGTNQSQQTLSGNYGD